MLTLAGCGSSNAARRPATSGVPLVAGARVVSQTRRCDRGVRPYCAMQLVLAGRPGRFSGSEALLDAESARLRDAGWSQDNGDTNHEHAAESPHHRLRVTYAIALEDLLSIDQGTITRAPSVARALSAQMFARAPALSLELQAGSS